MDAEGFKRAMARLPEPVTELQPPYWEHWRHDLYKRVLTEDVTQFWEWPCIYHCMLVEHWQGPVAYELAHLDSRYWDAVALPRFGPGDGILMADGYLSRNMIHQAYHIQQWENATGQRIAALDTIIEFGSGYGAMALLCHRLGFDGRYVIYDLPEFSLLQEYYLSHFGLLDKVTWNPKKKPKDVDLFMALYSLSEIEPGERMRYLPSVVDSYLFLYSGQWEKWNNVEWFQKELPSKWRQNDKVQWQHTELAHLPDGNNWYTLGW